MAKTKNVIIVWHDKTSGNFEEQVPLLYTGRRNRKLGSLNELTIIFLKGMKSLSPSYLTELKAIGYELVDAEPIFNLIFRKYAVLDRFGSYERYCFLRWLVLAKLYPAGNLIHYDGDIVWELKPETISQFVTGKTLVLGGGPSFTVISDPHWFTIYKRELNKFTKNPSEYGTDWEGTEFRKKIGSDQDLIGYLLQKNILPQDELPESKYSLIENPLSLIGTSFSNLAFWHMQTDFIHYVNLHYLLAPYGLSRFTPHPLEVPRLVLKFIYLLGLLAGRKYLTRRQAYLYWFEERKDL